MESSSTEELEQADASIQRQRQAINSDVKMLEPEIDLARDLEEDRFKKLEPLIEENRKLRETYLSTMKLSTYAMREQAARDKLTEMAIKKEGYFKQIDSAINVAGVMEKKDYLDILGIKKEAYDSENESNPLLLLGRLRQAYQSNVLGIRRLWKNAMPIDYKLLDKAKDEDVPDMFKTTILYALNEVRKDSLLMGNPKISNKHHTGLVDLGEPWVKTVEYSIALEMQGEALVDATNPIYRATDTRLEKVEQEIADKKKELDNLKDVLSPKQKEAGLIDERIRIAKLEEDTVSKRVEQKRSEYEELIKQMMTMKPSGQEPGGDVNEP